MQVNEEENRRGEYKRRKEEAQFKIDETKLLLELKVLEEQIAAKKPTSKMEGLQMEFDREAALFFGAKEIARKWKKHYEEVYRDDEEMLADAMIFLKAWEERQT